MEDKSGDLEAGVPSLVAEPVWRSAKKRTTDGREDEEGVESERNRVKRMEKRADVHVDSVRIRRPGLPTGVSKRENLQGSSVLAAGKKVFGALSSVVRGTVEGFRNMAAYVKPRLSNFTWNLNWNRSKAAPIPHAPVSTSFPVAFDDATRTFDRPEQSHSASFLLPLVSRDCLPTSVSRPLPPALRPMSPSTPFSSDTKFSVAMSCQLKAENNGQIVFQMTDNSVVYQTYDQMEKHLGQFDFSSSSEHRSFSVLSDDFATLIKDIQAAALASGSYLGSSKMPEPCVPCSAVPVEDSRVGKGAQSSVLVDASTQADDGNTGPAFPPTLPGGNPSVQEPVEEYGTANEPTEEVFEGPPEELAQTEIDKVPEILVESGTKRKVDFDEEGQSEGGPLMQDILSGIQGGGEDSRTTLTFSDEDGESETPVQQESPADDANMFQSEEMAQSSQSSLGLSEISSSQGTVTSVESSIAGSSGFPDDGATFSVSQSSGRPRKRRRAGPATPSRALYPRAAKERGEAARVLLIPPRRTRAPARNRGRRQLSEPPISPPPAPFRTVSDPMSASQPF